MAKAEQSTREQILGAIRAMGGTWVEVDEALALLRAGILGLAQEDDCLRDAVAKLSDLARELRNQQADILRELERIDARVHNLELVARNYLIRFYGVKIPPAWLKARGWLFVVRLEVGNILRKLLELAGLRRRSETRTCDQNKTAAQ